MITKLNHWWQEKRSSYWFVPAVMVLDVVVLATALIIVDATVDLHVVEGWPLLFGAGAASSRGQLTAVAGSTVRPIGSKLLIRATRKSMTYSMICASWSARWADGTGRHLPVLSRISDQKSHRTDPALPEPKPQEKA